MSPTKLFLAVRDDDFAGIQVDLVGATSIEQARAVRPGWRVSEFCPSRPFAVALGRDDSAGIDSLLPGRRGF